MDPSGAGSSHHPSQPYASVSGSTSHCETGGVMPRRTREQAEETKSQGGTREKRKEWSHRFTGGIAPLEEYISSPKASALRHSMSSLSTTTTALSLSLCGAEIGDIEQSEVWSHLCRTIHQQQKGREVEVLQ